METSGKLQHLDAIAVQSDPSLGLDGVIMVYIFDSIEERLRGKDILELGCRGGRITGLLASVCDHLDVVDGSSTFLERTKQNVWASNIDYHWSLFEDFEPKRKYSDIILVGGLDHVDGPVAFLKKYAEYLAPGGALHLVSLNALSMHRRLGVKMGVLQNHSELNERERWVGHLRVYGPATLRRDIEAAGLSVTSMTGIFLKPLATGQLSVLGQHVLDALYELGKELPEWCNYVYFTAEPMFHENIYADPDPPL